MKKMFYYGVAVAYLVALYVLGLSDADLRSLIITGLMAIVTLLCLLLVEISDARQNESTKGSMPSYLAALGILGSMAGMHANKEDKEKDRESE